MIGILIFFQLIIHVCESFHDLHVINGQDPKKVEENKKWHTWDAVVWTLVHLSIAVGAQSWELLFTGLVWRFVVLQIVLNYLRPGVSIDHLGTGGVDKISKQLFTRKGTLIIKIIISVILFIYAGIKIFQSLF